MAQLALRWPGRRRPRKPDEELEQFRALMTVPASFEEGFNWKSLAAALFIAMLMVPGAIYMGLLAGQGIGPAAQWVTVILFVEVARRAQNSLKKAEIYVLYYMAGAAVATPFSGLLWNQFYIRSQAAQSMGISSQVPFWVAPQLDSTSYALRSFFHPDWLVVIGMVAFQTVVSQISNMVVGYGLFRITSDVERLPFPMAPVGAQGIMALAEDADGAEADAAKANWRWRVFAIGGALGLGFGAVYYLLPTVTGALTGTPVQLLPIPFFDFTSKSQGYLPAVATGICWDFGQVLVGMVLPFFAVLGTFVGLLGSLVLNPVLFHNNMLPSWTPGDDTVATAFHNNIDFYLSFGIGISLAVAVVGIIQVVRGIQERKRQVRQEDEALVRQGLPAGRGDIRPTWIFLCHFLVTAAYILLSGHLIGWHPGVMMVLTFLGFIYTPLISYVTARLEGMAGMVVEIPMIREVSLILSGYHGAQVWFLPIPMANYGTMTVFYRKSELTGTRFTSIWKAQVILLPVILLSSFLFMNFIWKLAEVPSPVYPYAQKMWELNAANASVVYSSTMGEYSIFEEAFKPLTVVLGMGVGLVSFAVMGIAGAPVMLMYGVVRGIGNPMTHFIIPEIIGALIGRYYFQKRLGLVWRQYIPVVVAGFSCGMGLVTTLGVGITFLSKAVVQLPF